MSSTSSNVSMEETLSFPSPPIPPIVEFWIYTFSDALSLPCTLFVLYCLLSDRALRHALNNHIIIILLFMGLICELTNIPWFIYRFRYNRPLIETSTFYLFSFFCDYGISTGQIVLFSWATIERHILIFHDRWISTKRKRFFVHYLPIIIILFYCLVYFVLITFVPFCENSFDLFIATNILLPCIFNNIVLGTWDILVHQVIPTLIIVIFSIALLIRVIWQKRAMNQQIQWRKHRKMTIQLLSISVLYLVCGSPFIIIAFAGHYGLSGSVTAIPFQYAIVFRTYIILIFPFVCFGSLSELRKKCKRIVCWKRQNQIGIGGTREITRTVGERGVKIKNTVQ